MFKKQKTLSGRENLVVANLNSSVVSEQFRTLRSNITFSSRHEAVHSIVVTSAVKSEGKSTVAANLAVVYAQEGKKVLLVDSDIRKPSIHNIFSIRNNIGLSTFLNRQAELEEVVNRTFIERLDILPSGPLPPNPAELLSSEMMDNLMRQVKSSYNMVIFDSPPLLAFTDGQIISNRSDASLLVINSGETDQEQVVQAKETLSLAGSNLIGVILNNFRSSKAMRKNNY